MDGNKKYSELEREIRWRRFHRWENQYDREYLRRLSPLERIRIYEGLYQTVLRLHPEKIRCHWESDERGEREAHIKYLMEMRKPFLKNT